jgi:hypothetical protein
VSASVPRMHPCNGPGSDEHWGRNDSCCRAVSRGTIQRSERGRLPAILPSGIDPGQPPARQEQGHTTNRYGVGGNADVDAGHASSPWLGQALLNVELLRFAN